MSCRPSDVFGTGLREDIKIDGVAKWKRLIRNLQDLKTCFEFVCGHAALQKISSFVSPLVPVEQLLYP
jgi:hypothetical protein